MNRIRLILLAGLCIFVALLSIAYITVGMDSKEPETTTQNTTQEPSQPDTASTEPDTESETTTEAVSEAETTTAAENTTKEPETMGSGYEYAYAGFNPSVAVVDSEKWYLLLVNQDYILPEGYTVQTAEVKGGGQSLDHRVVPHYNKMIAAAEADGIDLIPVSGYRSLSRQKSNFQRKIDYYASLGYSKAEATRLAAKIVLMPGTSEHNAGLAMDFGTNGNYTLDENFANTEAFKWLSENAADYGFILRYEEDTQDITKITYEPWHWRYVGVDAAKEIKAQGVTLEEYLGMD